MIRLIIAIIISWIIIGLFIKDDLKNNFEDLALGTQTSTYFAKGENNDLIHLRELNNFDQLYNDWSKRGKNDIILLMGNSQYHGINQMKPENVNLSQILYNHFIKHRIDFITNSLANVNLQEQYLIFAYFAELLPIKMLILPVFMDDTREDNIRFGLPEYLSNNANYNQKNRIVDKLDNTEIQLNNDDLAGLKETFQEKVEFSINQLLNKYSLKWSKRPELRGELFFRLYTLRNSLFGISPSTKRRKIIGPYKDNMYAYELILQHCKSMRINTLVYIPPIRNDLKIPYDSKEYIDFKNEVKNIAQFYNTNFVNLENIVPGEYWGLKASTNIDDDLEWDFMHFQYSGHKILADTLLNHINNILLFE